MLKRVPLLKQLVKRLSMARVARQLEDALAVADKVGGGRGCGGAYSPVSLYFACTLYWNR
jgi:hypothetical protein